jgi:hypothetical protein
MPTAACAENHSGAAIIAGRAVITARVAAAVIAAAIAAIIAVAVAGAVNTAGEAEQQRGREQKPFHSITIVTSSW